MFVRLKVSNFDLDLIHNGQLIFNFNNFFPDTEYRKMFSEIGDGSIDLSRWSGYDCFRECVAGVERICYFKFTLENYQVMGA